VPYASGIPLTQGSNYYIVAYHFQGGGGDNLGAAFWTKDGNYTLPPAGDEAVWPATNIAMLAQAATVTIVSNPVSVTVLSGTSATFSALGASDSTISVDDVTNVFVSYQWYTNGVPVAGAIGSSYTTPLLPPALTGEQVYCAISAIGAGVTNTTAATLTITKDTVPPIIESVTAILDSGGTGSESTNQYVDILFSKAMDPATLLNIANYSITGATITGVTLFTNEYTGAGSETMAILTLASPYKGSSITVNLSGITDLSGVAPTTASGSGPVDPLTSEDISLGEIDVPGSTFYTVNDGIAGYEVDASGNDIWTDNDSFRFVYTTRTNNFDVVVQVTSILPADTWTKAGLMARETIDPLDGGSRMFYDVATASTNSPVPLDGSAPENDISAGWRSATDTAAFSGTGAASNANSQAYYFIGDGVIHPTYPNQWLRMTRTGVGTTNDQFTGYASSDGQNWTLVTWIQFQNTTNGETGDFATNTPTLNTPFPDVVYVGMCTTAHITPPGLQVGVATYQDFADYVAVTKPVITAKVVTPTSLSVSWSPGGGALYSSPVLTTNTSSWTLVTTNNPAAITITAAPSMFFQVVQ